VKPARTHAPESEGEGTQERVRWTIFFFLKILLFNIILLYYYI